MNGDLDTVSQFVIAESQSEIWSDPSDIAI